MWLSVTCIFDCYVGCKRSSSNLIGNKNRILFEFKNGIFILKSKYELKSKLNIVNWSSYSGSVLAIRNIILLLACAISLLFPQSLCNTRANKNLDLDRAVKLIDVTLVAECVFEKKNSFVEIWVCIVCVCVNIN